MRQGVKTEKIVDENEVFWRLIDDKVRITNDVAKLRADFIKYMKGNDITSQDEYWRGYNESVLNSILGMFNSLLHI